MPNGTVLVIDTLGRKNDAVFPIVWNSDVKGGWTVVADIATRDAIPAKFRELGMEVKVIDADGAGTKYYSLDADLVSWTEIVADFIPTSEKGAASGVAELDANGFVPANRIKNLFLNDSFIVADQAARFALTTITGNFVIQQDDGSVWIKLNNDGPPSDAGDWASITTPGVVDVNGQTGSVTIDFDTLLAFGSSASQFETAVTNSSAVATINAAILSLQNQVNTIEADVSALSGGNLGLMRGVYDSLTAYNTNEYVEYDTGDGGEIYRCIQDSPGGIAPTDAAYWIRLAAYYTTTEVDNLLANKADLDGGGKVPLAQIPAESLAIVIVDDITARNALTGQYEGMRVLVLDASADPQITSGAAEYIKDSDHPQADGNGWVLIPGSNVSFVPSNPSLLNSLIDSGDGKSFLTNAGTYTQAQTIRRAINQVTHGLAVGNVITYVGGAYAKVDATNKTVLGVVESVADVDNFVFIMTGYIDTLSGLTGSTIYYAQTDGSLGTTDTGIPVLYAVSATAGYLLSSGGSQAGASSSLTITSGNPTATLAITETFKLRLENDYAPAGLSGVDNNKRYTIQVEQDEVGGWAIDWTELSGLIRWPDGVEYIASAPPRGVDVIEAIGDINGRLIITDIRYEDQNYEAPTYDLTFDSSFNKGS